MWHPPESIRHELPEARWPSAEEASGARLFSPVRVGRTQLSQRTWVPAMVPWRATEDGEVTTDILEWYGRFARGRPGAIVVEATGVRDIASGPLLRIGHDRFLPGLRKLVETVRKESGGETRLFIQILDFLAVRRRPTAEKFFQKFWHPSAGHRERLSQRTGQSEWKQADDQTLRDWMERASASDQEAILEEREWRDLCFGYREQVTDLHREHVRNLPSILPKIFAAAAARAREVGFDGVELHFAHAYTLAGFLSARNDRDDGYGGDRVGRLRLPLEVLQASRASVGPDFTLGIRFLGEEAIEGGTKITDAAWFGSQFALAGADFLSVSKGGKFEDAKQPAVGWAVYPYTGPSGYECMPTVLSDARGPFGRNVELARAIRHAVHESGRQIPVITSGGICTFEQAEGILQGGAADIVAAARQTLADPDWFLKMREGKGAEIRRCTYTNYCEGLDQKHKQVTCKLWDRVGVGEPGVPLSADGKRRLVAPEWTPGPS